MWDTAQAAFYYHNTETDETSWVLPDPATTADAATSPRATAAAKHGTEDADAPATSTTKSTSKSEKESTPSVDASARDGSVAPVTKAASPTAANDDADPTPSAENPPPFSPSATEPPANDPALAPADVTTSAADLRPMTLVWWSDAGDVWNGFALSGLLAGYGPRRYRNLGGGYYMTTLDLGPEWAASAAANLGQGVPDPAATARIDWVPCTASAPGYGLFLRWAGDDDEQKLFDVPFEYFEDPPPDPAIVAAEEARASAQASAEAAAAEAAAAAAEAAELAEMEREAEAAVAATEQAEAAGESVASAAITAAATVAVTAAPAAATTGRGKRSSPEVRSAASVLAAAAAPAVAVTSSSGKKRKSSKGSASGGVSAGGALGKKRKGTASLIDKWKAVASTAGEEAEKEAEKLEKMERWKARAAAQDPDNPNFTPLGRRKR